MKNQTFKNIWVNKEVLNIFQSGSQSSYLMYHRFYGSIKVYFQMDFEHLTVVCVEPSSTPPTFHLHQITQHLAHKFNCEVVRGRQIQPPFLGKTKPTIALLSVTWETLHTPWTPFSSLKNWPYHICCFLKNYWKLVLSKRNETDQWHDFF